MTIRTILAAAVLVLAMPVAATAQSSFAPFLGLLKQLCTTPGPSLDQRTGLLKDWRIATDAEQTNLLKALAEGDAKARLALNLLAIEEAKQHELAVLETITMAIDRPDAGAKGAARLLMHPTAAGIAVLVRSTSTPQIEYVDCSLLLAKPQPGIIDELNGYFTLFPMHEILDVKLWTASSMKAGHEGRREDGRRLVYIMNGDTPKVAILGLNMQLLKK